MTEAEPIDHTSLQWSQGKSAPETMGSLYGVAIVHGNVAYFSRHYNIYSFQPSKSEWSKLQSSQYQSFGMAVLDYQLTTIGGMAKDQKRTKCLFSLTGGRSSGKKWKELYPPMPTQKVCPASLTTPTHLVVAGGRDRGELRIVEVMNRNTFQWSTMAEGLPEPIGYPQMTLCAGSFFISKHQTVFSCSVEEFLHSCQESSSNDSTASSNNGLKWSEVATVPLYSAFSLVSIGGQMLAIGGHDENDIASGVIQCYDTVTDSWTVVGEMPTTRADALAAFIPNDGLVVVGGWSETSSYNITEIGK